jgi:hypothetical protein
VTEGRSDFILTSSVRTRGEQEGLTEHTGFVIDSCTVVVVLGTSSISMEESNFQPPRSTISGDGKSNEVGFK